MSGLTGSLTIPSGLTSIETGTFYNCSGLTGDLIIPSRVKTIGASAFSGCSGFTSVTIPSSVTNIVGYAFYGCSGATEVIIESQTVCKSISMISGSNITNYAQTIKAKYQISGLSGYTSQGNQGGYYIYTKNA